MPLDWSPLWLSLRYAALATALATALAVPLGWLLARRRFPGCDLLDAASSLPLVLPPAVLAYYLLFTAGFRWRYALAVSTVYTLPLVIRMWRAGLENVGGSFENAARSLGAGEWRIFWRITLPLGWQALLAAVLAGFARAFVDIGITTLVSTGGKAWIAVPIAAMALAALYAGNRLRCGRVWA